MPWVTAFISQQSLPQIHCKQAISFRNTSGGAVGVGGVGQALSNCGLDVTWLDRKGRLGRIEIDVKFQFSEKNT